MLNTTRLSDNLTRLDLVPSGLTGFDHFISSYVLQDNETTFLIDIGPASTAPDLLYALQTLDVTRVDYILLTHIHLDHAGAAGHLARGFPDAKIVCHPMGLKHLHQPQKLWQSSLSVLKDFAVAYHEPQPAPLAQLVSVDDFTHPAVSSIKTPGHAPHHVSYIHRDCLFIGEAAGVFFNLADGYLRPATPPRFVMAQAQDSLQTLERLEPKFTAFAHYGVSDNGLAQIRQAQGQLELWAATARRVILDEGRNISDCIDELLKRDPLLRHFNRFNAAEQQRERGFYENALLGIVGWLTSGD